MAQIQRIHADPSGNEAPQRAQTAASTNHGHETKSHRESPELRIRTGLPQMIRRNQLRLLVPLADSTIYEMEQRGELRILANARSLAMKRASMGATSLAGSPIVSPVSSAKASA